MVAILGAAAATGIPRCRSNRCLANVAAWAELPRAQVTTRLGLVRCDHPISDASGSARASACRRKASGASRSSLAIWSSGPTIVCIRYLQAKGLVLGCHARKCNGAIKGIARGLNQMPAGVRRNPLRHCVGQSADEGERTHVRRYEARRQCVDMPCGTLHELDRDWVPLAGMADDEGGERAIVTRRGPRRPTHDSVRVSAKVGEEIVEESSPGNRSEERPEHLAQGFAADPGATPFVRDGQTPPAYAVLAALKLTPAD